MPETLAARAAEIPTIGHKLLYDLIYLLRLLALPASLTIDHIGGDAVADAGRIVPLAPDQTHLHPIFYGISKSSADLAHEEGTKRVFHALTWQQPGIHQ